MADQVRDWGSVLTALARGDRTAHVEVTGVLMALLARERLFAVESHWDDICQEVLVRLIDGVRSQAIRNPSAFISYCATTIRRESYLWLRRYGGSRSAAAGLEAREMQRSDAPDLRVELARALDALPEKLRQVMDAIYLQGCTYEEAAERLGMPLGTLKRAQTDALRALREKMDAKRDE